MAEPDLSEGIHYSIMFYGGRLLNHLTVDAEELKDFINLRSLNHNMAVVIDSDKPSAQARINKTKKRIRDEISKGKSICWITKGREIENYIDHDILQAAVKEKYKAKYTKKSEGGKYDHALNFYSEKVLMEKGISKVEIARLVCKNQINLDILDLKKRITEIVNMIKEANN